MICPKCGKEYNEKMTCCVSCGCDLVPYDPETEQTAFGPVLAEAVTEAPNPTEIGGEHIPESTSDKQETAEIAEVPEEVSVNVSEKKFSRAAKTVGSFAAAVVMFALIMLSAASYTARLITDSGKISEFADKLDVMSLPIPDIPSAEYEISPDSTVQEAVYAMSDGTGLTREDIREIYENSTAEEFLADQLCGYAGFIREGSVPEKLTTEKLKTVFNENVELINGSMDKPLSEHDIDLAYSKLESTGPALEAIAPSNIEAALGEGTMTFLRLFCSRPVMIGEACAAAAMLIILWLIHRRGVKVLSKGGGTILAAGLCVLVTAFLCSLQVFLSGSDRLVRGIAKSVTDVICPDIYRLGVLLAIIGIVMLIWSATLKNANSAK